MIFFFCGVYCQQTKFIACHIFFIPKFIPALETCLKQKVTMSLGFAVWPSFVFLPQHARAFHVSNGPPTKIIGYFCSDLTLSTDSSSIVNFFNFCNGLNRHRSCFVSIIPYYQCDTGPQIGQNLWNNLGNGKWIWDQKHGTLILYRKGSLKIVASNLAKYNFSLVAVQDIKWDSGGSEPADIYTFYCGNGSANHHLGMGFFIHKWIMLPVKRVGFISDRIFYITQRGCWCIFIVLKVHAPTKDKCDDKRHSFYDDLECVFVHFL